jgi:transposase
LEKIQAQSPAKIICYIDETGIDEYLYRPYARAKRGRKVYRKIRGRKFERTSIVAGKTEAGIVAPMMFNGTADSALFEYWFENYLCPEIAGNIAILDNASIHRKTKLYEIAKKHDITLLFLPPYSPNLNKIEGYWAWLKDKLRSCMSRYDKLTHAVFDCF